MHPGEQTRPIESIEDVIAVLDSDKASFDELMECVAVTEASRSWSLRQRAADRMFTEIRVDAVSAAMKLATAAGIIIENYLKGAGSLDELMPAVDAANGWLDQHQKKLNDARAHRFVDDTVKLLAELRVLMISAEPDARIRLCSRLRMVERPDLGADAVRPVANADKTNIAALTTLGAAYCDMGEFHKAERVLRAAYEINNSDDQTRVALSRVLQESGRMFEAFDLALAAFRSAATPHTAHRLLAAASGTDNEVVFDEALSAMEEMAAGDPEKPVDIYLLLLAAEAMVLNHRYTEAMQVVETISGSGVAFGGSSARRFLTVKMALKKRNQPSLFE